MSNIRHKFFVGANVVVDIDSAYIPPHDINFTMDTDEIFMDSIIRTMDENPN